MPYRDQTLFEEIVDEIRTSSGWFIIAWAISAIVHAGLLFFLMQINYVNLAAVAPSQVVATITEEVPLVPPPEEPMIQEELVEEPLANPLAQITQQTDMAVPEPVMEQPIEPQGIDPLLSQADVTDLALGQTAVLGVRAGIGAGIGGPRGLYGARSRQGRANARRYGATAASEAAVEAGLLWLAKVQEPDGRWDAAKWGANANVDLGVTGLATLCFLGAGHTHSGQQYSNTVRKALDWMVRRQTADGNLGWTTFYEQGIATMALSEDAGMLPSKKYRDAAQKALNHIINKMGPDGGFGYGGPGNDTSVTGWQVMALKSGKLSGLQVPDSAIEKCKTYLAKAINPDGSTGYRYNTGGGPAMTATGLVCRLFLEYGLQDANVVNAANLTHRTGVQINNEYYNYYGTLAMFQIGKPYWTEWNNKFCDAVVARQVKDGGPLHGSWDPAGTAYGGYGGRVYVTAMYILSLEVYYRFLPVYRIN